MKLIKYKVTNFRSVDDSGFVDVFDVTTLIGTNESGKTNMMLPLYKLNPAEDGEINLIADMPRKKYLSLRALEKKPIFIRAVFSLMPPEKKTIADIAHIDAQKIDKIIVGRDYNNNLLVAFIDPAEDFESFDLENASSEGFYGVLSTNPGILEYITKNLPRFVYYSSYGNIDSEIYLPQVIANFKRTNLGLKEAAKVRTLKMLFKFVQLDAEEIQQLGTQKKVFFSKHSIKKTSKQKKEREILLQSASTDFTENFNNWWRQGNYIFDFQADGDFFRIWVADAIRNEKIELEARSTGLQWFFSFYLTFLILCKESEGQTILLLDEPGLSLHPRAQEDLFAFFEKLSEQNQIIFSTHSPFMINSSELGRVNAIYIDTNGTSKLSTDLRGTEYKNQLNSVYPVSVALNLKISNSLMANCQPIIVANNSDQIYFNVLKNYLCSLGDLRTNRELIFIPSGGASGVKAILPMVSPNEDFMPYVVLNSDEQGNTIANTLNNGLYKQHKDRIIVINGFNISNATIEDLIPSDILNKLLLKFMPKSPFSEEEFEDVLDAKRAIIAQIDAFKTKHNLALAANWREDLAKKIKIEIIKKQGLLYKAEEAKYTKLRELFAKLST